MGAVAVQLHDLLLFYQSAHAFFESGSLKEETHDRYRTRVAAVMSTPGGQKFWSEWASTCNTAMTSAVDERMAMGDLPDFTRFPQYELTRD